MDKYLFFSEKEFSSLTPSCSLEDMSPAFMHKLDLARSIAGIPFVLNCAFRPYEWEISHGRNGLSYHCAGRAVDVRCKSSENRYKVILACLKVGLKVGIYKDFLHIDNRAEDIIFIGDKNID